MTDLEARMAELRRRFVDRARADEAGLAEAWAASDHQRVRAMAHSLAGAAGLFGYPEVTRLAQAVERAIEAPGDAQAASAEVEALLAGLRGVA